VPSLDTGETYQVSITLSELESFLQEVHDYRASTLKTEPRPAPQWPI